jgi:hypothetical protein
MAGAFFMMVRKSLLFIVLWLLASTAAFAQAGSAGDELARSQFLDYLMRVQGLARLEDTAVRLQSDAIDKVKANQMSADSFERLLDGQVIPTYKRFVLLLQRIKTPSAELARLHQTYLDATHKQLQGFIEQRNAVAESNFEQMETANQTIEEGRRLVERWMARVDELRTRYQLR